MNQYPHSWRASDYTEAQLTDLRQWMGMSETTIMATLIAEKHASLVAAGRESEMEKRADRYAIAWHDHPFKPDSRWTDRTNLLTFRAAANYAAKIVQNEKSPTGFTVWDMNFEAVVRVEVTNAVEINGDLHEPEHAYIGRAVANAIAARYPKP